MALPSSLSHPPLGPAFVPTMHARKLVPQYFPLRAHNECLRLKQCLSVMTSFSRLQPCRKLWRVNVKHTTKRRGAHNLAPPPPKCRPPSAFQKEETCLPVAGPTGGPARCCALTAPLANRAVVPQHGNVPGLVPGQGSALCALGPLQQPQARPEAVGCWTQPGWLHNLCQMAVKECGSSPVMPRAAAALVPCSRRVAWQHVPVTRR